MPSKTEATFLGEMARSVSEWGHPSWWYKIPDSPIYRGSKNRFTPPKPFDAILIQSGEPMAIEAKVHKKHRAWPLSSVKAHQIEGLQSVVAAGGRGVVLVNVRYGLGKDRENFAAWIPVSNMVDYMGRDVKSLKVRELKEYPLSRWDTKRKIWLSPQEREQ